MTNPNLVKYKKIATDIQKSLSEVHEPVVVEFAGTPKSGKTTCLEVIAKYFRRNGIDTIVINEQSIYCPVSNKLDLSFNIWTGTQSLDILLEAIEKKPKIIFLDRGIFDTVVWLKLLYKNKEISEQEFNISRNFFLLDKWVDIIKLVVVVRTTAENALFREYKDAITDRPGRIMNRKILQLYNESLDESINELGTKTFNIVDLDTTDKDTVIGVEEIADSVITLIDNMADEPIALINKSIIKNAFGDERIITDQIEIDLLLDLIWKNIEWQYRTKAEEDVTKVQIVPVGVFKQNNKVVIFDMYGREQGKTLQDKRSIWIGGHTRMSDKRQKSSINPILKKTLIREIKEEINKEIKAVWISENPSALIWDFTDPHSIQHLGIFFQIFPPTEKYTDVFESGAFWENKEKSLISQIRLLEPTIVNRKKWENWSLLYLKHIEKINIKLDDFQRLAY